MTSKPGGTSSTSSRVLLGLGLSAAVLVFLTSAQGEDAWLAAGLFLMAALLGLVTVASIWLPMIKTRQPPVAVRGSLIFGIVMVVAALAGHGMRQAGLRPTMQRVESLATAVTEHHRTHRTLPESLAEIEASLPPPARHLYDITYEPGVNGEFCSTSSQPGIVTSIHPPPLRGWCVIESGQRQGTFKDCRTASTPMTIRSYHPDDTDALAEVYRDSVRGIGPQAYGPEQIAMWSAWPDNLQEFEACLALGLTLVAEVDGRVVALGQLHPVNHIVLLYCSTAHARRGIASAIYARLEEHAYAAGVTEITTNASRLSRPLFEKQGFTVVKVESAHRSGVEFERFKMVKQRNV